MLLLHVPMLKLRSALNRIFARGPRASDFANSALIPKHKTLNMES